MSATFKWCKDKTKLAIWDKQVFFVNLFGNKCWHLNGQLHRLNGPACEYANGDKSWYLNGKRHREDGPAIEWVNGTKYWYLNGYHYSESEYWKELNK